MRGFGLQETVYAPGLKHGLPTKTLARIARIYAYILVGLIVVLFAHDFLLDNLQILLPTFATIGIFLYFSFRLRSQIQGNILGEIGFVYLAFAVAYTLFPAYGFVALDTLRSYVGVPILETLLPSHAELGLQLWRHVLFIAAVALGYLLFRAGRRAEYRPKFGSFDSLGRAEKLIVFLLFSGVVVSIFVLWWLAAPVHEYIDYYTRYDHLPWIGLRLVALCTTFKTGGTYVLLTIMFRNYRRYHSYIWPFVLLRVVQEILDSFGARIDAFIILISAAVLHHYCVKQITFKKALAGVLALILVFSVIATVRLAGPGSSGFAQSPSAQEQPSLGELAAVFVPGFHLYAERSRGTLPPVPWQLFFNDFISSVPFVGDTKWNPMYWYANNYFPDAAVPPITIGPIALSALWGGEVSLFVEGFLNGVLFAFLMRWFAKDGSKWTVMTVYVFCYSTCIMCLKYSIFWHLTPLVRTILPLMIIVSVLAKYHPGHAKLASARSAAGVAL